MLVQSSPRKLRQRCWPLIWACEPASRSTTTMGALYGIAHTILALPPDCAGASTACSTTFHTLRGSFSKVAAILPISGSKKPHDASSAYTRSMPKPGENASSIHASNAAANKPRTTPISSPAASSPGPAPPTQPHSATMLPRRLPSACGECWKLAGWNNFLPQYAARMLHTIFILRKMRASRSCTYSPCGRIKNVS